MTGSAFLRPEALLTGPTNEVTTTSTMDCSKLRPADGNPLYQQVAAEIRRAISRCEARPRDRMPLAKDLVKVLGVNTNTALRALRELRDEGCSSFDAERVSRWLERPTAVSSWRE